MFKPVSGAELTQFDQETRNLFRMRESDPRVTQALLTLPRTYRNYVPVLAHEGNAFIAERENYQKWFPFKLFLGMVCVGIAGAQF